MFSLNQKAKACGLVALLLFSTAAIAVGQVVTGTILGRVTDSTGGVLAGAMVQILNVDTSFSRTEQTDSAGRYESRNLPLGSYTVTVTQTGFQTQEQRGISLSVGSEVTVNAELAVGNVQEKVEVTAEAAAVETTNATVSSLVTSDQMRDLPLNGRSVDQLTLLTPGLSLDKSGLQSSSLGQGTKLSINGSRVNYVLYLLDGTFTNDASGGGPASAAHNMLGVEGILEFRFLSHGFDAEYGRLAGGVLSLVTRSGTNQFHGSLYEFVRNDYFDARNFFNPGSLPPFRRNQFGGALGGPIVKDRVFFFVNYEGLRQVQGTTVNIPVPDLNARQGFLPCTAAPTAPCNPTTNLAPSTLNPAAVPFLNVYPLPNGPELGGGTAQYLTTFFGRANEDYSMERMDFRLTDKDNLYGRYVFNPSNGEVARPVPIFGETDDNASNFFLLSETHVISSTSLNELRAAFNRTNDTGNPATFGTVNPAVTLVPGQALGRIQFASTIGAAGQLPELGTDTGRPQAFAQNIFQETDTFSTIKGAHSLKFGIDVEREQINFNENSGLARGKAQFGGLAALMAGTPTNVSVVIPGGNNHSERGFRRDVIGWFVQDDFRVRPNLTLSLGLRQDIFTNPSEVNGYIGDLIHITDPTVTAGTPYIQSKNTFAPRVGLAWDPTGSGKTSIRVGGGMYYNPVDGREMYEPSTATPLFLNTVLITNPPFPNVLANGFSAGGLQSTTAIQHNVNTPAVVQYNLEVQRQLTRKVSLRAGYVGSTGYDLMRQEQANLKIPTYVNGQPTFPASGPTINPAFSTIALYTADARSNYNALQATLQQNLSAGLQFAASYTWSKAMSNADQSVNATSNTTPSSALDPNNLGRDWSPSVYDQRQALVVNGSYQLPFKNLNSRLAKAVLGGWSINGIYTYTSGLPVDIEDGFNNSRNGDNNNPDRPNLNPGFSPNPINGTTAGCVGFAAGQPLKTVTRWFDPCAFSLSPAGTYGNLGRNTVTMPGTDNVDATLVKNTAITERIKLEFRWELFNMLNHAAFSFPNVSVFTSTRTYNGSAGNITTTVRDNREMQLGLKLIF